MSSLAIYNLVRTLTRPYVGGHVEYTGNKTSIWKVEETLCDAKNTEPGKVLEYNRNGISVKCYDNAARILEYDFELQPSIGEYL